jgi:hypothetical protein
MDALTVHLEGIGWWSPQWPTWAAAARALRGEADPPQAPVARPAAGVLAPGERRRAPDQVLLACEVAEQACTAAGRAAGELPCVFVSMHGDVVTTDAVCTTLASAPLEVSPTRFHNSVHNAAAGYWTVATGCREASTALAAGSGSFAAGLLETAIEALAEQRPVLFAAYDVGASSPLAEVMRAEATLGAAFVLNAVRGPQTQATLRLRHEATPAEAVATMASVAAALPLLRALARGEAASLRLPAGAATALAVEVSA